MMTTSLKHKKCILCWEREATTAEHIFKGDIYAELMPDGKSIYKKDGRDIPINGRYSKKLKPKKNLCVQCNSHISQGPDKTFSKFEKYLRELAKLQKTDCTVIFKDIFPDKTLLAHANIKRYFAKIFACYIHRGSCPVPKVLGEIFLEYLGHECLEFKVSINKDMTSFNYMENGKLYAQYKGAGSEDLANALASFEILPSRYTFFTAISGVEYNLSVNVPECEILDSIKKFIETGSPQSSKPILNQAEPSDAAFLWATGYLKNQLRQINN